MMDARQLLDQYLGTHSESAFSELVARNVDLVYSAALRLVGGDTHLAEDVTQTVFVDLVRKAGSLPGDVVLPGWLHQHACFTASKAVRTERRRQAREQTAMEMSALDHNNESSWELIAPHLHEGLNQLDARDRDAIVLRFLKQQDLHAMGAALGISDAAAQKRVSRALDKLRELLSRRGITTSAAALSIVLSANAVQAAPVGLAVTISTAAALGEQASPPPQLPPRAARCSTE
jgi:RNA polymerase sigma factor (sigma-70 family)